MTAIRFGAIKLEQLPEWNGRPEVRLQLTGKDRLRYDRIVGRDGKVGFYATKNHDFETMRDGRRTTIVSKDEYEQALDLAGCMPTPPEVKANILLALFRIAARRGFIAPKFFKPE